MKILSLIVSLFFVLTLLGISEAYNQNPSINTGNTGSLDGIVPPPGGYFSLYSIFYTADSFQDKNGDKLAHSNKIDIWAEAPQFIYMFDRKIFGLRPGLQAVCAIQRASVDSDLGFESGQNGFGDLCLGALISGKFNPSENSSVFWFAEFDTYLPTGRYDHDYEVNPGANFYTFEPFVAVTWLLPHGFEITSRIHYTFNTTNHDWGPEGRDMKPGELFHLNYTLTKTFFIDNFRMGVTGAYLKQLTDDEIDGRDVSGLKEKLFSIGPTLVFTHKGTYFTLSTMYETNVENRPKGIKTVFRFIYKFW